MCVRSQVVAAPGIKFVSGSVLRSLSGEVKEEKSTETTTTEVEDDSKCVLVGLSMLSSDSFTVDVLQLRCALLPVKRQQQFWGRNDAVRRRPISYFSKLPL